MFSEVDGKLSMVDRFGTPVDLNVPVESFGFKGVERLVQTEVTFIQEVFLF